MLHQTEIQVNLDDNVLPLLLKRSCRQEVLRAVSAARKPRDRRPLGEALPNQEAGLWRLLRQHQEVL